jgi:FeS assembly SUF system protein
MNSATPDNLPTPQDSEQPEAQVSAPSESAPPSDAVTIDDVDALREDVIGMLKTVFDPEIPVNIYELGMIYEVKCETNGSTYVKMTLTSPACPVAGTLPGEVQGKVADVEGVSEVKVDLVWEPPWTPDLMTEAAKLQTGMI